MLGKILAIIDQNTTLGGFLMEMRGFEPLSKHADCTAFTIIVRDLFSLPTAP